MGHRIYCNNAAFTFERREGTRAVHCFAHMLFALLFAINFLLLYSSFLYFHL